MPKIEKDLQIVYGKCALFGEQNLVTGEVIYTSAAICRSYDLYCGREGKLYETKEGVDGQDGRAEIIARQE